MEYDLEAQPLQILTDSLARSGDLLRIEFGHAATDAQLIDFSLEFTDPPKYSLSFCGSETTITNLPASNLRLWTFIKSSDSLTIICNDVEIVNFVFSSAVDSRCDQYWQVEITKFQFKSDTAGTDTASDMYRSKLTGIITVSD